MVSTLTPITFEGKSDYEIIRAYALSADPAFEAAARAELKDRCFDDDFIDSEVDRILEMRHAEARRDREEFYRWGCL